MRSSNVGSRADPLDNTHHEWVLWPASSGKLGANRLLTLMSGMDWDVSDYPLQFRPGDDGKSFVSVDYDSLVRRGYFQLRHHDVDGRQVVAIGRPIGAATVNPDVLLMALSGKDASVTPVSFKGPWPHGSLLVFEAQNWNEEYQIASRINGRVLVLELVPNGFRSWGAYWMQGPGWPSGLAVDPSTHVPGLVRARHALQLLVNPSSFEWVPSPASKDNVSSWFDHIRRMEPFILGAFAILVAYVAGCAVYCIGLEQRGELAATLLLVTLLVPAVMMISGEFSREFGLDQWYAWLALSSAIVGVIGTGLNALIRTKLPDAHPLLAISIVGLGVFLVCDPLWSAFSGPFGFLSPSYSPEATGLLCGYLTGVVAFSRGTGSSGEWIGRFAVGMTLAQGVLLHPWWVQDGGYFLAVPILAWLAGEGWLIPPVLLVFAFIPMPDSDPFRHGFVWAPLGAYPSAGSKDSLNIGRYFSFLISPGLAAFVLTILGAWVFTDRFFFRQMQRIFQRDPRLKSLPMAAAGLAAMSVFNPTLFSGALFVAYGALIAVLYHAVWTL